MHILTHQNVHVEVSCELCDGLLDCLGCMYLMLIVCVYAGVQSVAPVTLEKKLDLATSPSSPTPLVERPAIAQDKTSISTCVSHACRQVRDWIKHTKTLPDVATQGVQQLFSTCFLDSYHCHWGQL